MNTKENIKASPNGKISSQAQTCRRRTTLRHTEQPAFRPHMSSQDFKPRRIFKASYAYERWHILVNPTHPLPSTALSVTILLFDSDLMTNENVFTNFSLSAFNSCPLCFRWR